MKEKFISTKVFDGYSTVFRQWRAEETHCKYLHGYGVSFLITFEGELDERNWVWDFGGMKRAKGTIDGKSPKDWMDYAYAFKKMDEAGVAQVRIVPAVGAERFAQFVFTKVDEFVQEETEGRVSVKRVEFRENNKNSAIYEPR
mgnify:CR=1 FL=1